MIDSNRIDEHDFDDVDSTASTQVADISVPPPPVPNELVELHEFHETYRAEYRSAAPPGWFAYEVCNSLIALPQGKLGYQYHLPVCRPGLTDGQGFGWRHACDVLVVAPAPTQADVGMFTCLAGQYGAFLFDQLKLVGIDMGRVMVTHAIRFPLPDGITSYSAGHKASCQAYVRADAWMLRPKVIITLGADALRCFFGRKAKLDSYRGSVFEWQGIPVVPSISPLTFARSLAGLDIFRSELYRAVQVMMGAYRPAERVSDGHQVCTTAGQVEDLEQLLLRDKPAWAAIDTEWGNDTGREEDGYLLTFQLAWAKGKAAIILLRGEGGTVIHQPGDLARIRAAIVRMMAEPSRRLIGHHLRVDVEMPSREGMNFDDRLADGFDTMLAHWLLYGAQGDESNGLDNLIRKYRPDVGAYWKELEDWLDANGRKERLQYGYRDVPYHILLPYALTDADETWQVAVNHLMPELAAQPKLQSLFTDLIMPGTLHLLDVERHGILVDQQRVSELRDLYQPMYDQILAEFREEIAWPEFNSNSKDQKATFLFSTTRYRDRKTAPEGAKTLALTPLYNTDKYPREWADIIEKGEEDRHFPSTKASTLDLLYQYNKGEPLLKRLKQLSVLGKFLSTYLLRPELNEHGVVTAGKNIAQNIWKDGRVRGHIGQVTSTGRESMRAANLQTSPKRQEEAALAVFVDRHFGLELNEYRRRTPNPATNKGKAQILELGDSYIPPERRLIIPAFKSCYIPAPGHVLMEADFKTAELCILAYCSGDSAFIKLLSQGRDLHAEIAAREFQLSVFDELAECRRELELGNNKPYKQWVDYIKVTYPDYRTAAKTVIFGLCLAEGASILTSNGWKTIESVQPQDLVWDGVEWVAHGGVTYNGIKECVEVDGVWMTPDHEVLTGNGWHRARELRGISRPSLADSYFPHGQAETMCRHDGASDEVRTARVYDIVDAGPRNRFQAGGLIVHNCYGRGAYALAREISKTGTIVTPEQTELIISGFAREFPQAWSWLQNNMDSAIVNGYVEDPFGFRRYFTGIDQLPDVHQAAARREAANAPIQGAVARLLSRAGVNLHRFRYRTEIGRQIGFKTLLRIHDAALFEFEERYLKEMKSIVTTCMSTANPIPGTDHRLGIDIEVYRHRWGEKD